MKETKIDFEILVSSISNINNELTFQAKKAVNISLTMRNWLIGCYIFEYELNGADRAKYGKQLLTELSKKLKSLELSRSSARELRRYCLFYKTYPQIWESVTPKFQNQLTDNGIWKSVASKSDIVKKRESGTPISAKVLLNHLSFTHISELLKLEDETARRFYEVECISGCWSVRELKRQIGSLYYERSGLSLDKHKLSKIANQDAEQDNVALEIRDPLIFDFLGLKAKEVMSESHLEDELYSKLEDFLLELGNGFCFEAKQKRILIGDEYFFIDLVFYHRVLKCHILIELKLEKFSQANIGQLNTYVSWYRKNMMTEGDNPPVGILLCTDKNNALVEYALAGMDNNLFVSKYQLELPKKEIIEKFINEKIMEFNQ